MFASLTASLILSTQVFHQYICGLFANHHSNRVVEYSAFEKVLENPERYRCGENYRATNIVFPVKVEGNSYVFKKPRHALVSSVIHTYYSFQGDFFNFSRLRSSYKEGIRREIAVLEALDGLHAPRLVYSDFKEPSLIREYIDGDDFRSLFRDEDIRQTLEGALEAMTEMHQEDHFIGDANVKNILLNRHGESYWLDFEGFFGTDVDEGKVNDILKFVYSIFAATRDEGAVIYAAELVAKNYPDGEIKDRLRNKFKSMPSRGLRLWFPTRFPADGKLYGVVKRILES